MAAAVSTSPSVPGIMQCCVAAALYLTYGKGHCCCCYCCHCCCRSFVSWLNDFEAALLAKPVANLTDMLDVPAAIDYWLATEVTKNPDGFRGSVKMHKDRGGALVMGPLWVRGHQPSVVGCGAVLPAHALVLGVPSQLCVSVMSDQIQDCWTAVYLCTVGGRACCSIWLMIHVCNMHVCMCMYMQHVCALLSHAGLQRGVWHVLWLPH